MKNYKIRKLDLQSSFERHNYAVRRNKHYQAMLDAKLLSEQMQLINKLNGYSTIKHYLRKESQLLDLQKGKIIQPLANANSNLNNSRKIIDRMDPVACDLDNFRILPPVTPSNQSNQRYNNVGSYLSRFKHTGYTNVLYSKDFLRQKSLVRDDIRSFKRDMLTASSNNSNRKISDLKMQLFSEKIVPIKAQPKTLK